MPKNLLCLFDVNVGVFKVGRGRFKMPSAILIEFPEELNILKSAGVNKCSERRKRKIHKVPQRSHHYDKYYSNYGIVMSVANVFTTLAITAPASARANILE